MRILIITNHYLDNNSGGSFASRAFVNAFSEIADSCMLLYPDRGIPIDNFIHKKCILKGIQNKESNIEKVIDIYYGRIHRYLDVAISQINEFNPNLVVFDNSRCSAGLLKKVKRMGKKIITIHHNYEVEYYNGSKPFIAWRIPFMHYMKKAESVAVQFSDLNLTLTEQDIKLLQINYDPKKTVKMSKFGCFESISSLVEDDNRINDKDLAQNHNLCFVITGSLNAYQTEVSVILFLKNIYPELLKKLPESKLIIAGSNPSMKIMNACKKYPSISVVRNPVNMQDVIEQADVYICPICVGGGLKLRVMDGLKAGLPVLTHTVSARGYDDFKKANCLFEYVDKDSFMDNLDIVLSKIHEKSLDKKTIKYLYHSLFSYEMGVKRLKEILSNNEMN